MNDALPLFALAAVVCSLSFLSWIVGHVWLRARELGRVSDPTRAGESGATVSDALARVEARLARLEESVDATAIEVERIAEAQRFAARRLAVESAPAEIAPGARGSL